MPLILGAQSAIGDDLVVTNSCRWNDGDSPKMSKTLGTATLNTKWTLNVWLKMGFGTQGINVVYASSRTGTTGPYVNFLLDTNNKLNIYAPNISGANDFNYLTNRVFRDLGAWYMITVAMDTTLAAAGDRLRIYVNGTEETNFDTETNPTQDDIYPANYTGYTFVAGARTDDSEYFDGYMAEFCLIDGQQLTPSSFGEFNEDSPTIWQPIDVSGLTFGNNGFYLDFEDSSNLGNDANGGTDLTEVNFTAADQATDTPSNNFCTGNPLDNYYQNAAWSEGNCNTLIATGVAVYSTGTMGMTAGKWYWEQQGTTNTGGFQVLPGIAGRMVTSATEQELGEADDNWGYYSTTGNYYNDSTQTSYGDTFAADDIIGVAVDLDNNKLYFAKNGVWQNSGVPTSGATGTGAISVMAANLTTMGLYLPAWTGGWGGSVGHYGKWNFGGCSAFDVTSAASDGNGYGNFEYAPPSGYLALCTKNLGSDGG